MRPVLPVTSFAVASFAKGASFSECGWLVLPKTTFAGGQFSQFSKFCVKTFALLHCSVLSRLFLFTMPGLPGFHGLK